MTISSSMHFFVPYADTDQMGVVYYANYLKYFEMCRSVLMRDLGYPYGVMEQDGYGLPVVEAVCRYKKSAKFDDDLLITAFIMEAKGIRIQIGCTVKRGDELLAEGHTVHACLDLKTGKPCRLPPKLVEILQNTQKSASCSE